MNKSQGEHRPILGPDGKPMIVGRIIPASANPAERPRWEHDPENPTHKSFPRYCAWRETKCRRRDTRHVEQLIEEMDEATHQFVGEVAELAELIFDEGLSCLMPDIAVYDLISEIGDIFFCGLWLLDAYRANPFRVDGCPAPNELRPEEELAVARSIAERLATLDENEDLHQEERQAYQLALSQLSWKCCIDAGILCNYFKKIRWQQRAQSRAEMAERVVMVLYHCAHILAMAGATVEDALARNIEKLDTRFPDGYTVPGGGIREGKGA
jgi:hypothetical protein